MIPEESSRGNDSIVSEMLDDLKKDDEDVA